MVRRAKKSDIKSINLLGNLINSNFEKLFDMEIIINEEVSKVFVFEEDNIIKGFIHITELKETADIINLVVMPEFRRQRVGTILIDYMISDINPNVKTITLEVADDNEEAIRLYEKFGFEIINTRRGYYSGKDAYLMGRVFEE